MRKRFEKIAASLTGLLILSGPAMAETSAAHTATKAAETPNPAVEWNHVWTEVLWDLWIIGIVFGIVAIWLLVKYRAKSPDAVGTAQPLNLDKALAWALVPAALFMADDFLLAAKGWSLWNIQRTVPANALEIKVSGNQWYFEYDYGQGVTSDELIVPVGRPVVLRMTSNDVIHSFGLTEYRVKEDVMPGRITYLWFLPDKPLVSNVVCVEFCGNSHSQMTNPVKAVAKAEFDDWLTKKVEKKKKAELDRTKGAGAPTPETTAR